MVKSANLGLPFVEASQAQKHVTVNEGLQRLDAVAQLVVQSASLPTPPEPVADGAVYAVPAGAGAPWSIAVGQLAVASNGGWEYVQPKVGWRAWVVDLGALCIFDGAAWLPVDGSGGISEAGMRIETVSFDQVLAAGTSLETDVVIPAQSCVVGVTGRVTAAITGSLTAWRMGVAGSDNRYGSGFGIGLNSYMRGLTGSPLTYYEDTPLLLSAEGGNFSGGTIRLVVHTLQLGIPDPV